MLLFIEEFIFPSLRETEREIEKERQNILPRLLKQQILPVQENKI